MREDLIKRLRREADISAKPGQMDRLNALADEFAVTLEAMWAEVERLWEIIRPKREKECLTLDDWRTRAYYLEANWSRCSRACAVEQTKRERAEARANKLAEALHPHIEDLERSAVVLDQYPAMAPTAAEMRKAAAELRAALARED